MATKELQTRIALKYDSYVNWTDETKEGQGAKLVLLPGELGICYVGDTNQESNVVPTVLFKVGDGKKTFKELPWASAKAADVYSWAKASDVVYSQNNKTITFVKGNVDGSDKVITFNYMTEADVKLITDGLATRISALEGKFGDGENTVDKQIEALDGRLDTAEDNITTLGNTKLDASEFTAFNNGTSKTVAAIEADIVAKANAAKSGAETTAATALAGEKSAREAAISAMDAAYKKAVADEAKARDDADKAIDERLDKVEAFFEGAAEDSEGLNNALDKLVDIQNYLAGEGSAADGLMGQVSANATAIENLEKEFNTETGRVKVAEKNIGDLQAAVATKLATETFNTWKETHEDDHAGTAAEITAEIAAAVLVEENARKAADKEINDKIGTVAEGKTVSGLIDDAQKKADQGVTDAAAVAGRMNTVEGEIDALQAASHTHDNKDELALIASGDKAKWDEAYNKRHEHANKAELDLIASGDKSKWDTAATNAGKAVADLAALTGEGGRLTVAEGNITTIQGIVNSGEGKTIRDDVTTLQTLTAGFDGTIKAAVDAAKKAGDEAAQAVTDLANDQVKTNKINIEGHETRIAAIEGDYLKAADVYVFNCGSSTTVTYEQPKA